MRSGVRTFCSPGWKFTVHVEYTGELSPRDFLRIHGCYAVLKNVKVFVVILLKNVREEICPTITRDLRL